MSDRRAARADDADPFCPLATGCVVASGYRVTVHADGASAPLLGADASHAWVSVWCAAADDSPARRMKSDPTHSVVFGRSHLRWVIGRNCGASANTASAMMEERWQKNCEETR